MCQALHAHGCHVHRLRSQFQLLPQPIGSILFIRAWFLDSAQTPAMCHSLNPSSCLPHSGATSRHQIISTVGVCARTPTHSPYAPEHRPLFSDHNALVPRSPTVLLLYCPAVPQACGFDAQEVEHLVCALFEASEYRRDALGRIRASAW